MQKRQYKAEKKKNGAWFVLVCAAAVFAVAAVSAFFARSLRQQPPAVTTELASETVTVTETVAPETTAPPETTLASETTLPVTTADSSIPETTEIPVTTEITERTFVSVLAADGVRRIENFIFMETDTPEYRLAELLFLEVPPVVKTMEVTETVVETETADPLETTAVPETTLPPESSGTEIPEETTSEPPVTVTYEVEGSAAVYYKDLTDGEVIAFAPDKSYFGASLIKAVYVYALLQVADRGEIDLEEKLVYTKDMFVEGSGNFKDVEDGKEFTVQQLLSQTVRYSDNTAYAMLQARFGTAFFAAVMQENGLAPTRYGAWWRGTAKQFGAFFEALHRYFVSESENAKWLAEEMVRSTQTVMLQRALAPEKVAHKYGWDENSYCDGAVVLHAEHPYVVVFLSNMDEGHLKRANTNFIYAVCGLIKQMHDAKYAAAESTVAE